MMVKKFLIWAGTLGIIMVGGTSAYANDTATGQNWQGLYGGFAVGSASAQSISDSNVSDGNYFITGNIAQLDSILQDDISDTAFNGSAILGYNFQNGNLVYGIEADLTGMNYSVTQDSGSVEYSVTPNEFFNIRTTVESKFAFSILSKIGYSFGNTMIHLATGPTVIRFKYKFSFSDTATQAEASYSDAKIAFGVSYNIGVNHLIGKGWSLRWDYIYSYYHDIINGSNIISKPAGYTDVFTHDADFQSHNIRIGLIKRF